MSHAALQAALLATNFMTGHIPDNVLPPPRYGELRSYLPPESRPTFLAIALYASGVTPWSWARDPDWLDYHDQHDLIGLAAYRAGVQATRAGTLSFGLAEAVMDAEEWLRERGQYIADPETGKPVFANEETVH